MGNVCTSAHIGLNVGSLCACVLTKYKRGSLLAKSWLATRRDKDKSPSGWQKWSRVGAECRSVEVIQRRACRSPIKWVERAATPGPCLKSRLAPVSNKGSLIQNSSARMCLVSANTSVYLSQCLFWCLLLNVMPSSLCRGLIKWAMLMFKGIVHWKLNFNPFYTRPDLNGGSHDVFQSASLFFSFTEVKKSDYWKSIVVKDSNVKNKQTKNNRRKT